MADYYFPIDGGLVSWDTEITENWDVDIAVTASGRRRTLCQQVMPGWTFTLNFPKLSKSQVDELLRFYASMKGQWGSFWYKDYEYHHMEKTVLGKVGTNTYQCIAALGAYAEPAGKVSDLEVFVDGSSFDKRVMSDGKLNLGVSDGAVVTATYDYYFLVCFKDALQIKQIYKDVYSVNINLGVVRE